MARFLLLTVFLATAHTGCAQLVERTVEIDGVPAKISDSKQAISTSNFLGGGDRNAEVVLTFNGNFTGIDDPSFQTACEGAVETAATKANAAAANKIVGNILATGVDVLFNGGKILDANNTQAKCRVFAVMDSTPDADKLECIINDGADAFANDVKIDVEETFANFTLDLQQPVFELDVAAQDRCVNQIVETSVVVQIDGQDTALVIKREGDGSTGDANLNAELIMTLEGNFGNTTITGTQLQGVVERALLNTTQKLAAGKFNITAVGLESAVETGAILNEAKTEAKFTAFIVTDNSADALLLECDIVGSRAFKDDLTNDINFELDQRATGDAALINVQVAQADLNENGVARCNICTACDIVDGKAGIVAQHFIGLVLVILLLPLGLDTLFRIYFAEYYQPGTAAFFLRSMILEMIDLLAVATVFEFDKDQVDEAVLLLPVACNSGAILISLHHTIKAWNVTRRRKALLKRADDVTQDASGASHISDKLRSDIERFNDDEKRRHESMKSIFMVLFGMEIGDVAFVGNQYFNFCNITACSYFGSLATVISASMLVSSLRDFVTYKMYDVEMVPLHIDIDDVVNGPPKAATKQGTSKNLKNKAPAVDHGKQGQQYQHVRGMLDDMLSDADAALYVYSHPDIGTAPMSLEIHEMNQSADTDIRADACVWTTLLVRAIWRAACVEKDALSVSTLHLVSNLCSTVRRQLDGFAERAKLELARELLQRAASCLPQSVKGEIESEIARWETMKQPDSLKEWRSKNVAGLDDGWSGEFMPTARKSDGVIEYRRTRPSQKLDDLALYRDHEDHNWKICGIDAQGEKRKPRYWTSTAWGNSNKLDEPPQNGWFKSTPQGSQTEVDSVVITSQPFDTYAMRTVTNSFLNDGKSDLLQQLKMFAMQNFDLKVLDDSLLQWLYMKATNGQETITGAQPKAVARGMTALLKQVQPSDKMPEWAENARDVLRGDPGEPEFNQLSNEDFLRAARDPAAARAAHGVPLLCSHSALKDRSAIEAILRVTVDEALPVERYGKDESWPLMTTLTYPAKERALMIKNWANRDGTGAWADINGSDTTAYRQKFFRRSFTVFGKVYRIPPRFWFKNQFKDKILYVLIGGLYFGIFMNAARLINTSNEDVDAITFFGLPPQYDMTDPLQAVLVPLIYAVMHCNLLTFGLLPLPMCRNTIKCMSSSPTLAQIFHLDHVHFWHRILGYLFMGGVVLGGVFWWFALGHACVEETTDNFQNACDAFHTPPGGVNRAGEQLNFNALVAYVNIFENLAAVLFLRELVISSFIAIFSTALLVYPLGGNAIALPIGWVQRHAFEIFYYTHVVFAYTVAALAFASRFEVFYPTLPLWGWYVFDCLNMRFNHTMKAKAVAKYSSDPTNFVHLKIRKQGRFYLRCWQSDFHFSAGQTAFVNIPSISKLQWHPFSIASAPSDSHVEFLIDAGKYGKESWTGTLWHSLANREMSGEFDVNLMGPCGSAFQASKKHYGVCLIGGGSGLTSSLSVLRDILHQHRTNGGANPQKVWLYWVTRHVDGMIWCWDALKSALEGEGLMDEKKQNVAELSSWLTVSIHVTGCARSADEREQLDRLIRAEQPNADAGLAGGWLLHNDRVKRSRVKSWRDEFISIHQGMPSNATCKVLFCGPTPMAADIGDAARSIKGFEAQFSSENFNEGKRPTPKLPKAPMIKADGAHIGGGGGLDRALDDFKAAGVGGHGTRAASHAPLARGTSMSNMRNAARFMLNRLSDMGNSIRNLRTNNAATNDRVPMNTVDEEAGGAQGDHDNPISSNPTRTPGGVGHGGLQHEGVSTRNALGRDACLI